MDFMEGKGNFYQEITIRKSEAIWSAPSASNLIVETGSLMKILTRIYTEESTFKCSPERALLTAVLSSALLDYFSPENTLDVVHSKRAKLEAASWLFDEAHEEGPFSFAWVCEELDICPQGLRERLIGLSREMRDRKGGNPLRERRVLNFRKAA